MKKRLDDKFWRLYGHCFDCQIKIENKMRINGTYDTWEKEKWEITEQQQEYMNKLADEAIDRFNVMKTEIEEELVNINKD